MDLITAQSFNAAAFVVHNKLKNENDLPITFDRHKFLIDPYMDNSPRLVIKKCGQIGFSTAAIIRAFHLANYVGANVIYTLPTKSIIKDFVKPKVDPLIANNPALAGMIGDTDSLGLKSVGKRFVYFRSSWDEASGISISAHILINDELDRSNPKAIRTYKTRLDASALDRPDLGWHWKFSNPSLPGYGVDEDWAISDQRLWFIKCEHCNYRQILKWPENINIELRCYICQKCQKPISDETRINGQWVPKYFGRSVTGYHIHQLMATWISAGKIIDDSLGDQSVFHNFTLGEPYLNKEFAVTREGIVKCLYPTMNPRTDVAIGVDNGIKKHFIVGNRFGIFMIGVTEDWQYIEDLRNRFDAYMVCDTNPYPTPVQKLAEKYRGKVFGHYYEEDKKQLGTIRYGEGDNYGVVKSDRTKLLDAVVADINSQDLLFNLSLTDLENEEYIKHWENMYRTVETTEKGVQKAVWMTPDGKPDHYAHATALWKVAMQKTMTGGQVVKPKPASSINNPAPLIVNPDNTTQAPVSLDDIKAQLLQPRGKGWQYH